MIDWYLKDFLFTVYNVHKNNEQILIYRLRARGDTERLLIFI